MKNSNLFKKFAAIVLSVMMVLPAFAMPTFAAEGDMTIQGVKYNKVTDQSGQTTAETKVYGYQIVSKTKSNEWKPSEDYFDIYKIVKDENEQDVEEQIADFNKFGEATIWKVKGTNITYPIPSPSNTAVPSGEALEALAKLANNKTQTIEFSNTANTETWVKSGADKGSYLVLVKDNTSTETYNPMLVSRDNSQGGSVTAQVGNGTAYAKKSDVPFEKVVDRRAPHNQNTNAQNVKVTGDGLDTGDDTSATNADPATGVDGNKGDTAGSKTTGVNTISYDPATGVTTDGTTVYDDVWFRINTKVPDYAENYFDASFTTRPQFIVYDTLSEGLTFNDIKGDGNNLGMWVEADGTKIFETNNQVKITKLPTSGTYNGKTFVVEFTEKGLKDFGGKNVEICYSAKLNTKHGVNFDAETNTASLEYTRNPGEAPQKGEDKTTYHYTFTINGKVDANAKEENREVIKIGLDNNGSQVLNETVSKSETGWTPLAGVEFELKDKNGNVVKKVITDNNGVLRGMDQIDAGEYDLVETKLPAQYSQYKVNSNPIPVEITAVLDSVGRLESYKVKVNGITVGNYKKDYTNNKVQFLDANDDSKVVAEMPCDTGVVTNAGSLARHEFTANSTNWKDTDTEAADIINSKAGTLPSTGGIGTVIFTVGGIAIMALALVLLLGGKKKKEQN